MNATSSTTSINQRPHSLGRSKPPSRDKTSPLKRLDLARVSKDIVPILKAPGQRQLASRSSRLSFRDRQTVGNESFNKVTDTTDYMDSREAGPVTERRSLTSRATSKGDRKDLSSRGTTKSMSKDKFFMSSGAATTATTATLPSQVKPVEYVNRTLEKVEVTVKTLEALKLMAKGLEEVIRLFEEDCEKNQQEIYGNLHMLFFYAQRAEPYAIGFKALEVYFTVTNLYKDFNKTISLLKMYKSITTIYNDYPRKLDCYKWLALVYQDHQKIEQALMYLKKMLRLAWAIEDKDRELLSYDLLGIQYYYLGELEVADYFHQRMVNGELEPEDSAHFKIAKNQFATSIALRTYEDTLKKDEVHKIYVSSGEEDIELPSDKNKYTNNQKVKLPTLGNGPGKKQDFEEMYEGNPGKKPLRERKKSQNSRELQNKAAEIEEEEPRKMINVEEFARQLISKRKQSVGTGKITHKIRINHMSTNRIAENLHHLQHTAANFREDVIHGRYLDGYSKAKISNLLTKFQANIDKYIGNLSKTLEGNTNCIEERRQ